MPAPPEIVDLVKRFDQYSAKYTSPSYNEFQVRKEFIDPFFEALGWDVNNRSGLDERYKDVIHEDTVRVEKSTKAPDYSFRIGGVRKFFVEAKKPAVNLKENPEPAYQVRRYAWSAKLPVSLLTDFEEFIIYDCTAKPSPKDKASAKRIGYYRYTDYIEKWDEIAAIFSKQGILTGGYDEYVDNLKQKKGGKGTAGIDDAFLAEIEGWRDLLAKNIALRNKDLSVRELNAAVQKTIDRIVFLRICEDRGIEEYEQLKTIAAGKDIYERLRSLFRYADDRYNSGLFHFSTEPGREDPDTLTLSLSIDDKVLKQIISHLYYPDSPYEFSVFPADILGQVYEQFLGKVIRLTAGHQAKVEEKPEVKKAGGVFYTPTYIVEYIVQQTVGSLLFGKDPKAAAEIHVLDPACGSGSFLLGAYQYLLDWHLQWYMDHLVPLLAAGKKTTDPAVLALLPAKPAPAKKGRGRKTRGDEYFLPVYQVTDTDWRLTTEEKKRILLNNIYGVDIDPQAVEVTKLSLLLKVLEGEKSERIGKQLTITQERVLPSLHENIKCGNSLIGPDIYNDVQLTLDDEETIFRINAFDWDRAFPAILQAGGFDAVIGNPPYVRQEILGREFKEYAKQHYAVYHGVADLYTYFIEKGVSLLRPGGQFAYIVANKWMRANYGKPLRQWLKEKRIEEIVDFGDLPVFEGTTAYTCIVRVSTGEPDGVFKVTNVDSLDFGDLATYVNETCFPLSLSSLDDTGWSLIDEQSRELLKKLQAVGVSLADYIHGKIYWGVKTGLNKAFVIDESTKQRLITEDPKSAPFIKPYLAGKEIKRYSPLKNSLFLILFEKGWTDLNSQGHRNKWLWLKENVPAIANHLEPHAKEAEKRYDKGDYWWELRACEYYGVFEEPKILYPEICQRPEFTIDAEGLYPNNKCFAIPSDDKYLLGILNSKLTAFLFETLLPKLRGGFFMPAAVVVQTFPIRTIDPASPADVARHDRMVALVEQMLDLNKRLQAAKAPHEREVLAGMIDATDRQIDRLVYEIYGLTEDEVAIVEGVHE
ncbi:restriction endonuclease subunit R [Methanoculleus sp. FWC-SCC1]|uniref:site-specific DNA-methyltransferase (adenine-specific) n=1 Tax=Methanoculleus frigidifontis TaxID=2584085 RepID=A0ABT8M7W0_9EURY|nr:N-6 DNA methylase [Methanoculleus sp. FWC-SCC1]MDN7024026.1 restriction endonuclease subunit R [Methanoculleus sp. FWC-SCC1]